MRTILRELGTGFLLVRHYLLQSATVFILIALSSTIIALNLGDVLAQGMNFVRGTQLRNEHATFFQVAYSGDMSTQRKAMKLLEKEIIANHAFTYLNLQIHPENSTSQKPVQAIILIGHKASLMASDIPQVNSDKGLDLSPRAYLGASFPRSSFTFSVGGYQLSARHRLPHTAAFFSPHGTGEKLEQYVVGVLPPEVLTHLDETQIQSAEFNSIFLPHAGEKSAKSHLYPFIVAAHENGLSLIPIDLAASQPDSFRQLLVRTSIYVTGAFALMTLVFVLFWAIGSSIVRSDIRTFSIRYAFGAPLSVLMFRFAAFLGITLLLPAAIPVILTYQINWYYSMASSVVLGLSFIIYLGALIYADLSIRKKLT